MAIAQARKLSTRGSREDAGKASVVYSMLSALGTQHLMVRIASSAWRFAETSLTANVEGHSYLAMRGPGIGRAA